MAKSPARMWKAAMWVTVPELELPGASILTWYSAI